MDLVLGIDMGTSYFKLGLFDREGKLRGLGRVAVEKDTGNGTWCQLTVQRFWSSLREALRQALEKADAKSSDIKALAYSSQANTFILLDKHDQPLTPLILWTDLRADPADKRLRKLWEREDFQETTAMGCTGPGFAAAKLLWLQEYEPELWLKTARVLTISDYLVYCLTGEAVGDEGTASLLGLWDLKNHQWWNVGLEAVRVDPALLSTPLRPGTCAGTITVSGAELLGLSPGIPLTVGSLDHHMAAIGAGVGIAACMSISIGTVLVCLQYTQNYTPRKECCMGPGITDNSFYQLAVDSNGAGVLEWYRQNHAPEITIEELSRRAETVPAGSEGLVALPFADNYEGLEGFKNISPELHHGHYCRAIMESVADSFAMLVRRLLPDESPSRIVATGGGARSDLWLRINADRLGIEIMAPASPDTACMGAAMLAAVAVGWHECPVEAAETWCRNRAIFRPDRRKL